MESRDKPTLPLGTDVKNGPPPNIDGESNKCLGGCMNISTSAALANCGILVSNLVDTTTVLRNSGSHSMTAFLVVAFDQSELSSKHKMM